MRRLAIVGTAVTLGVTTLGFMASAQAQLLNISLCVGGTATQYPPSSSCALQLSISIGSGGQLLTIGGGGFLPNTPIPLQLVAPPSAPSLPLPLGGLPLIGGVPFLGSLPVLGGLPGLGRLPVLGSLPGLGRLPVLGSIPVSLVPLVPGLGTVGTSGTLVADPVPSVGAPAAGSSAAGTAAGTTTSGSVTSSSATRLPLTAAVTSSSAGSVPGSLGSVVTDASGSFRTTVPIPVGVPVGVHTVAAVGLDPSGGQRELGGQLTVVGDGAGNTAAVVNPSSAVSLNATTVSGAPPERSAEGSGARPVVLVGAGLVLAAGGAAAVGAARSRRNTSTAV